MSTLVIPQGYKAPLPNYELQRAIAFIKAILSDQPLQCPEPAPGVRSPVCGLPIPV